MRVVPPDIPSNDIENILKKGEQFAQTAENKLKEGPEKKEESIITWFFDFFLILFCFVLLSLNFDPNAFELNIQDECIRA